MSDPKIIDKAVAAPVTVHLKKLDTGIIVSYSSKYGEETIIFQTIQEVAEFLVANLG